MSDEVRRSIQRHDREIVRFNSKARRLGDRLSEAFDRIEALEAALAAQFPGDTGEVRPPDKGRDSRL